MALFLNYYDTKVITFDTLTLNMILTIFNLIVKALCKTLLFFGGGGREMYNTCIKFFQEYWLSRQWTVLVKITDFQ